MCDLENFNISANDHQKPTFQGLWPSPPLAFLPLPLHCPRSCMDLGLCYLGLLFVGNLNYSVILSLQLSSLGLGKAMPYLPSLSIQFSSLNFNFCILKIFIKKSVHFVLNYIDLCFQFPYCEVTLRKSNLYYPFRFLQNQVLCLEYSRYSVSDCLAEVGNGKTGV